LARKPYPNDEARQKRWIGNRQNRPGKGKQSIDTTHPEVAGKLRTEAGYFEINTERMRYPKVRGQRLLAGSGVIEAGRETVLGPPACSGRCGGQRHFRPALPPAQWPVRRLLGGAPGCTIGTIIAGAKLLHRAGGGTAQPSRAVEWSGHGP
jgi:hypothetical protein